MTNVKHEPASPRDEAVILALAATAGLQISHERIPEIIAKYGELGAQLRELEWLDLGEIVPTSGFDPGWEEAS